MTLSQLVDWLDSSEYFNAVGFCEEMRHLRVRHLLWETGLLAIMGSGVRLFCGARQIFRVEYDLNPAVG